MKILRIVSLQIHTNMQLLLGLKLIIMSELIPKVTAQSEPTFPYEGPFEDPTPTSDKAVIRLTASTDTLEIGGTATCDLKIQTGDEVVKTYTLVITFDPSVLEVVDSNLNATGVQINVFDAFSSVKLNSADNTAGRIALNAEIVGTSQTINRRIAQITFRAKTTGTSIVSINKSQSSVAKESGTDILGSTTSLNFAVGGQTQTQVTPTTTTTATTGQQQLPSSGLFDSTAMFGSILGGILMSLLGVKTLMRKKKGPNAFEAKLMSIIE